MYDCQYSSSCGLYRALRVIRHFLCLSVSLLAKRQMVIYPSLPNSYCKDWNRSSCVSSSVFFFQVSAFNFLSAKFYFQSHIPIFLLSIFCSLFSTPGFLHPYLKHVLLYECLFRFSHIQVTLWYCLLSIYYLLEQWVLQLNQPVDTGYRDIVGSSFLRIGIFCATSLTILYTMLLSTDHC